MGTQESLEEEISHFVEGNRERHLRALREFKAIFISYQNSAEGKRVLYRVASRGDYQYGDELKKLNRFMAKIENKRKSDPSYTLDSVEDIIGLRLVCIHPANVDTLKEYIIRTDKLIAFDHNFEPKEDESGYRALHVIAKLPSPELRDIKCEIQIKTILQEAWGFKTHGPIYEHRRDLKKEYMLHAKFLSDYLDTVDKQTEVLLKEIQREDALESQRRSGLIKQHLLLLLPKAIDDEKRRAYKNGIDFKSIEDPEIALRLIINLVKERRIADKSKDQQIIEDLDFIMNEVKEYESIYQIFNNADNFPLCKDLIGIIVLIEALDVTEKYRNESLNHIERLLRLCGDNTENKIAALQYKSLILYFLGDFKAARAEAKKAYDLANTLNNQEHICAAKNIYGYVTSEWFDNNRNYIKTEDVEKIKEIVFRYIKEAIEDTSDSESFAKNKCKDTLGFAHIVFGSNEDEIWKGIKICNEVLRDSEEHELFAIYYKKHAKRAYERILELLETS